ncbi:MAG: META domain-containing protein [Vicinamibacteria bacterium]
MAWKGRNVAAAVVAAVGLTACGKSAGDLAGPSSAALQGQWTLVSLQEAGGAVESAPAGFAAEFGADGTLAVHADCNSCHATYSAAASNLKVTPTMACTLAYCASAPFDSKYTKLLTSATSWQTDNGALALKSDAGVLLFRR